MNFPEIATENEPFKPGARKRLIIKHAIYGWGFAAVWIGMGYMFYLLTPEYSREPFPAGIGMLPVLFFFGAAMGGMVAAGLRPAAYILWWCGHFIPALIAIALIHIWPAATNLDPRSIPEGIAIATLLGAGLIGVPTIWWLLGWGVLAQAADKAASAAALDAVTTKPETESPS
ncbi:MAG: hypothetical protein P8P99_14410 [Maricaulis sp.]|nr:hypothetical protein [Maricaulis sp.]